MKIIRQRVHELKQEAIGLMFLKVIQNNDKRIDLRISEIKLLINIYGIELNEKTN